MYLRTYRLFQTVTMLRVRVCTTLPQFLDRASLIRFQDLVASSTHVMPENPGPSDATALSPSVLQSGIGWLISWMFSIFKDVNILEEGGSDAFQPAHPLDSVAPMATTGEKALLLYLNKQLLTSFYR
jgi:hypothetical protein